MIMLRVFLSCKLLLGTRDFVLVIYSALVLVTTFKQVKHIKVVQGTVMQIIYLIGRKKSRQKMANFFACDEFFFCRRLFLSTINFC